MISGIKTLGVHGNTKHGMTHTPTYNSWRHMRVRCEKSKEPSKVKNYQAKGITCCERWRSFQTFLADMGIRPQGMTLERKDNTAGYSPENCKWATTKEQNANRSVTIKLTFNGTTGDLRYWADTTGILINTLWHRLNNGWSVEQALTTVPRKS